jgi:hypothetical protein
MNTYTTTVQAGKIEEITTQVGKGGQLKLEGEDKEIEVSRGYLQTRKPSVGGYYLRHANDEELFMGAAAFEGRFGFADEPDEDTDEPG